VSHHKHQDQVILKSLGLNKVTLKKAWLMPFVLLFLVFSQLSSAADLWEKGRHYKELPYPVKTADPTKIEVLEVFWYGCPHCYEFNNDHLPKWEKQLAADVDFNLMPATFPGWVEHAKAFYVAEFLGVQKELHQTLFDNIVANPKKYKSVQDLKPFFTAIGVKSEDFDKVLSASGFRKISKVDEAIKKASDKVKTLRITGVPALIVNGKYKVGVRDAGSFANMLKITNYLVNQEREALTKK
jgi:thiol:disulfide interchange protein DsbA